ncbi:carboxymuconolactone decarboxylase family protein [Candidatus Entotheonella palauensis]|uniref:carboxymuconolactone decarboxylase family protein n=1 Tax=Candidatus Entotheonella palauensis TaxID=93172 RepID=UPI002118D39B|nr:carboxymuconolactone decarboxylase family protein [Candidatus Entotheonella palauensis]
MNETGYPEHYNRLRGLLRTLRKDVPGPMSGFTHLHHEAMADGTLDKKTKELIALGIAIAVRCDGCITYHVHDALSVGASRDEIVDTIGVAILMGGGPSVMYGAEALQAVEQFETTTQGAS